MLPFRSPGIRGAEMKIPPSLPLRKGTGRESGTYVVELSGVYFISNSLRTVVNCGVDMRTK